MNKFILWSEEQRHTCVYLCVSTMFFLCLFVSIMSTFCSWTGENGHLHAYSHGDIIIGGLFPIHKSTNRSELQFHETLSCNSYDLKGFLQSQVMIHAIREINQRTPRVLPNFTIGYDIYDTCGDVSIAIGATLQLLKNQSDPKSCLLPQNFPPTSPETKAVIGEWHSEVSVAVARLVALSSVAQISYASTSEQLSRKFKFPTFLRTISSDEHQTKAIAELVDKFNWKSVAIIGSDDEYGKYGSDNLEQNFRNRDICIEFTEILPGSFSQNTSTNNLTELVSKINNSTAEAIIIFTKEANVLLIIQKAIEYNLNRNWIASDAWSTSTIISALKGIEKAGEVFGFVSMRNEVPRFKDYVISNFNKTTNPIIKHYRTHYPLCSNPVNGEPQGDSQESKPCMNLSSLAEYIDDDVSYNVYLAVQVIVEGLRRLLKCNNHVCTGDSKFTASELFREIKEVNFTVNTTHIFFDPSGNPSLGYDILYWNMTQSKTHIQTIGGYWPNQKIKIPEDLVRNYNVTVTVYNCSKTCPAGHELKKQSKRCCSVCVQCANGDFSAKNGEECKPCNSTSYSSPQKNECLEKKKDFLRWTDTFVIILSVFAVLGIIVTIVTAILFAIYRRTPIVKAVGGYLCFLELFSLLVCFGLTFNFIGIPTKASCKVGLPVFGMALSLCIACILANLLQILVGFDFNRTIKSWIKKLNQPVVVVTIIFGIQLALCVPWLYFDPPKPSTISSNSTILQYCNKGSEKFFLAMLGYNALLALSCFLFAYKGRQLPDLYKNASLITTSMTLILIIWMIYIPIYISSIGKYKRAIQSAAILISGYSILGCHLAPKCYIMLFRKEINNENAITEYIRKHYEQKDISVVRS